MERSLDESFDPPIECLISNSTEGKPIRLTWWLLKELSPHRAAVTLGAVDIYGETHGREGVMEGYMYVIDLLYVHSCLR